MKICFISDRLPEYHSIWGGAETACYKLAKGLIEMGVDIMVITNKTIKQPQENFQIICIEHKYKHHLISKVARRLFHFNYYNPLLIKELISILKVLKPQLVHLHKFDTFSISILPWIKRLNIPIVASIYDYQLICPDTILINGNGKPCRQFHGFRCVRCFKTRYNYDYPYSWILQRVLFRHYLKLIDNFVLLSHNSSEILEAYGIDKDKISVIPLPLYEPDNSKKNIKEGLILFVGWLARHKGLHIIIEAMPQIIRVFPKVQLWIVETGVGPALYIKMVENLIDKLGLSSNIKFLGKLPHTKVRALLREANLVVIPEQWENVTPLILGEAASLGRPVVASRIGGIPEFVEMKEFLALADEPNDFANKIIWILENKEEALKLAESMRLKASKILEPKIVFEKIINLYNRLIKET